MSHPQVVQGTGEELLAYLEKHRTSENLTLIIPDQKPAEGPVTAEPADVAAANRRLRAHVRPDQDADVSNEAIDADLARVYSSLS